MEQRDDTDRMIDLGIAFESLYLKGLDSELSFRFQLRAAWYLGKDQTDREALMGEFKQIYDYRSKAVHTGALPLRVTFGGKQIKMMEFIRQSQDLCLQSIKTACSSCQVRRFQGAWLPPGRSSSRGRLSHR